MMLVQKDPYQGLRWVLDQENHLYGLSMFVGQGNPDFSDAKQTRVIIYTILSLLPVLFLIPFMLGFINKRGDFTI